MADNNLPDFNPYLKTFEKYLKIFKEDANNIKILASKISQTFTDFGLECSNLTSQYEHWKQKKSKKLRD